MSWSEGFEYGQRTEERPRPLVPPPPPRREFPWRTLVIVSFAVLLVAEGLTAFGFVSTRGALSDTRSRLVSVEDELDRTRADLKVAEPEVERLREDKAALSADVGQATRLLNDAKDCITGIMQSVSDASEGFIDLALGELRRVRPKCDRVLEVNPSTEFTQL